MTPEEFGKQKSQILSSVDLSRKGSVDDSIRNLIEYINNSKSYVTTSSCSGRVVLYCESIARCNQKKGCKWLYTTHNELEEDVIQSRLDPDEGNMVLKFEPFILHVQCCSLEDAKIMHTCAIESGFRNSGMTLGKRGKVILAVRSSLGLEVPLSEDGKLFVSDENLTFLIRKCGEKMEENQKRTDRFFDTLKSVLGTNESAESHSVN